MRRSPVVVGLVLGLVVGAGAVAAIASTSTGEGSASGSAQRVAIPPKVSVSSPGPATTAAPLSVPPGLPDLSGEAKGYRLGSVPVPGALDRLAAAFDIHGPVQSDAGGWVARDGNRLVRVQRAAGLPWFFATMDGPCKLVPESPPPSTGSPKLPPVAPPGPTDCPDTTPPEPVPGNALSQGDALGVGMDTLGQAGLGSSRPVIVDEPGGWYIEAPPVVDGKPTAGLPWTVTVGPGRTITAASGYLARPQPADTYRLVGVDTGLQRARQVSVDGTIAGVRLGLMLGHVGADPYLVPAYLFELEGQPPPIVPVPAVEDRYLA